MSNTYTWQIKNLTTLPQSNGQSNVVIAVEWQATATDGSNTISRSGTSRLKYVEGGFTPFGQLTEQQVISWLSQDDVNFELNIKTSLDHRLESLASPPPAPVIQNPPWI